MRWRVFLIASLVVLAAAGLAARLPSRAPRAGPSDLVLDNGPGQVPPPRNGAQTVAAALAALTAAAPAAPCTTTSVATLRGNTPGSSAPGGSSHQIVPGSWYGATSKLPVIATAPGWLDVRLAQRPNGSTAWIQAGSATLSVTPDCILIDLADNHLYLFRDGLLQLSTPAGVGTTTDPTPTGDYFVAFYAPPEGPVDEWGPFIIATSDHSDAIADWDGSGDAVIGIHGPIGAEIPPSGSQISHGCIRLPVPALAQLRDVPAGSPVVVEA